MVAYVIEIPINKIEPVAISRVRIKHIAFRDFESVICSSLCVYLGAAFHNRNANIVFV